MIKHTHTPNIHTHLYPINITHHLSGPGVLYQHTVCKSWSLLLEGHTVYYRDYSLVMSLYYNQKRSLFALNHYVISTLSCCIITRGKKDFWLVVSGWAHLMDTSRMFPNVNHLGDVKMSPRATWSWMMLRCSNWRSFWLLVFFFSCHSPNIQA